MARAPQPKATLAPKEGEGQSARSFIAVPLTEGDEEKGKADAKAIAIERLGGEDVYEVSWTKISDELAHSVWGRDLPPPEPPKAPEPEPAPATPATPGEQPQ